MKLGLRGRECSFCSLEKFGGMENLRRYGVLRCVVECLASYSAAAVVEAAAGDIVGEPDSDEQNYQRGTSYGLLGLSKRSSARKNGGVPTGCCAGFPCGTRGLESRYISNLLLFGGSREGKALVVIVARSS